MASRRGGFVIADSAAFELLRGRAFSLGPTAAAFASPALAFLVVLALAFFDGGYWPTAWGWSGLALAWITALALVLREEPRAGRFDLAFVAALAAVFVWILVSAAWSQSGGRSVLESQRALVYLVGVAAFLLLGRRRHYRGLVAAIWASTALVAAYALSTKLFPGSFERFDPIDGLRLSNPIGYWNALGAFCALGALLAIGIAAHAGLTAVRMLAAGSLPVLLVTLYFTFGRGPWLALGCGALVLFALESRRLQVALVGLVLAVPTGLALAVAYGSDALTETGRSLDAAIEAGRTLAVVVVLAAVGAAFAVLVLAWAERRVQPSAGLRRAFGVVLLALVIGPAALGVIRAGGPLELPDRLRDGFTSPSVAVPVGESVNQRLFSISGTGRDIQWRVAWDQFQERPLVGTGAGTYELHWVAKRPLPAKVRDVHNLYLETLAELGIVGMGLLGLALAVPLAAAFVARRRALVPAAAAAYVAYLAHAAVDWDWEFPALTLAALLCGGSIVIAARGEVPPLSTRVRAAGVAAALVVSAFALVGLIGSSALEEGWDALERGQPARALDEAKTAERWSPWSSDPLRLAAAAVSLDEDDAAARAYLRRAVERDPGDWNLWFDLAQVSEGARERSALARALRLNPLGPELGQYLQANEIPRADLPGTP
ncbi:MAG: O-antigen ligase family protein [Actinobacteria bacterium]|nr:O-antigen ligase family protein [Actinomycetota bacterium]